MALPAGVIPLPPNRMRLRPANELVATQALHLRRPVENDYLNRVVAANKTSAMRTWKWYGELGPVHKAISRTSRLAGFGWLRAARYDPAGKIERFADTGPAADIVAGMYSPFGGTRGLIERFFTLMKVPCDSVLIRVVTEGDQDGYHFLSSSEIEQVETWETRNSDRRSLTWITMPAPGYSGASTLLKRQVPSADVLGRVWVPGKQYVDVPDSALSALDTECELLHVLTRNIFAKLRSRFALAGIMFVPDSIQKIRIAGVEGTFTEDDILKYLSEAMTANVKNFDVASALAPILMRGEADAGDRIKHITIDREIFESDLKLRAEMVDRIMSDLDIQRQATEGNANTTRFTVWNSGDDERRYAIQPEMEALGWALTRLVLQPGLLEARMTEDEAAHWGVVVDLTALSTRTNRQDDTRMAHDRALANGSVVLDASGIDAKDRMVGDEYVRWVGVKTNDPYLATFGMPEADKIDWAKVGTGKSGPKTSDTEEPRADSGVGPVPGNPDEGNPQ